MAHEKSSAAVPTSWLAVVGIGEDGREGLSPAAARALDTADLVVGGRRHLELAAPLAAETMAWPSPMAGAYEEILRRRGTRVCVLASGDPFHHGVGSELAGRISPGEMVCFPQVSAFSLAAARMGWALQDCTAISLHGRALNRIVPYLTPRARILALSWDGSTPEALARLLVANGFGGSTLTVLERMGGPRERRRAAMAEAFNLQEVDPLNLVTVEVLADRQAQIIPLTPGLPDHWFETDGQITKADIRALTLSALAPLPGETLWDVGAGSGSLGIEWTIRHLSNKAIAIETREDRAARIARNGERLGADGLRVVTGEAPAALRDLPPPDAVFIGGGLTRDGVFETAWAALPSGGRLVANAVTIESEARLQTLFASHGGEMRRIAVSRLERVGGLHGWRPAMPVTQWHVAKP